MGKSPVHLGSRGWLSTSSSPPGTSQPSPEECFSTAAAAGRGGACRAPWHEGMIGHALPDHEYLSQAVRGTQGVYAWRRNTRLVKPGRWCSTGRGGSFQFALPLALVNGKLPPASDPLPHHTLHVAHGSCGGEYPFSPWQRGCDWAWPEAGSGLGGLAGSLQPKHHCLNELPRELLSEDQKLGDVQGSERIKRNTSSGAW